MAIQNNITLVLGAGVSYPYGFPLGSELVDLIIGISPIYFLKAILPNQFSEEMVLSFQTDLRESGWRSIDRFLQHRPELANLGKTLIAFVLMKLENPDAIYTKSPRNTAGIYSYLYNEILSPQAPEDLNNKDVVVITYNYDRSLEFFLWNSLRRGFGINGEQATEHLKRLPIYHVHGSFGDIVGNEARAYQCSHTAIDKASERLSIVHEDIEASGVLEECRKELMFAQAIKFLGFGYDRINVDRLQIPQTIKRRFARGEKKQPEISGTAQGFTQAERNYNIVPLFRDLHVSFYDIDCLTHLRDSPHLWQRS